MSSAKMMCPYCGSEMNHHADKLTYSSPEEPGYNPLFDASIEEFHKCPACGASASRLVLN